MDFKMSLLVVLLNVYYVCHTKFCGHDDIEHESTYEGHVMPRMSNHYFGGLNEFETFAAQNPIPNSNEFKNIRIHYTTNILYNDWHNKEFAQKWIDDIIPAAINFLQEALQVRPVNGNLTFSTSCTDKTKCTVWQTKCQITHIQIPVDSFEGLGPGTPSDINIYFSGMRGASCMNVYGYSTFCKRNAFDRPIAGYVNLCERTLWDEGDYFTYEKGVTLVVHEIFHVLGFSSSGFRLFRKQSSVDPLRSKRNWHDTVIQKTIRGKTATFLKTETVIEKAKEFYGCDSIIGIELEDYGGADTASSHWEQRILGMEVMIGYIASAAPFSIFTFAVMQDSGWYNVNWEYASIPPYAKKLGCDWFYKPCVNDTHSLDDDLFCIETKQYGCSVDYVGKSNCEISEWTNLATHFQYFDNKKLGGVLAYADYCPMFYHYSNGDCRVKSAANPVTSLSAEIRPDSKCNMVTDNNGKEFAVCWVSKCLIDSHGNWSAVMTKIPNKKGTDATWVTCFGDTDDGKKKTLPYRHQYGKLSIICPQFFDMCYDGNPWMCNGHGMFVKESNTCFCNGGYIGCHCEYEDTKVNRAIYPRAQDTQCTDGQPRSDYVYGASQDSSTFRNGDKDLGKLTVTYTNDNGIVNKNYAIIAMRNWVASSAQIDPDNVWVYNEVETSNTKLILDIRFYSSHSLKSKTLSTDLENSFATFANANTFQETNLVKVPNSTSNVKINYFVYILLLICIIVVF